MRPMGIPNIMSSLAYSAQSVCLHSSTLAISNSKQPISSWNYQQHFIYTYSCNSVQSHSSQSQISTGCDPTTGTCRHGQKGALPPSPLEMLWSVLVVTAKRPVNELFMHYFYNQSPATGGFALKPPPRSTPKPRWGFMSPSLICPPLRKFCRRPWTRPHLTRCLLLTRPEIHIFERRF